MKITIDKLSFIKAINYVSNRSFIRTTMPILEGILIEAKNNNIILTTNDFELGIECTIPCDNVEEGKVLVHSNTFSEIIKRLPDSDINLTTNENGMLCIECEGSEYKLATLDTEEFPKIEDIQPEQSLQVEQKILKSMIKQTSFAVGVDESKKIYTGCLLEAKDNVLHMVAIDGFRLAIKKCTIMSNDEVKVVIPGKSLNEISKILEDNFEAVKIGINNNRAIFEFNNCRITTNILEGNFMEFRSIISSKYDTKIKINKHLLFNSLDRISFVSSSSQFKEKKQPIMFNINIGKVTLSSNSSVGTAKEDIYVETEGQESAIKYNPKYFIEALRNIEDEEIIITFAGNTAPTIIKSAVEEDSNYIYVILPMRA